MTNLDELLWSAIEGALGTQKRAFLQNAPLTDMLGRDQSFALPHAMASIVASGTQKRAEIQAIRSGLEALGMVVKEASVPEPDSFLTKVAQAYKLRVLDPALYGGQKQAAAQLRRALGSEIMETVKMATTGNVLSGIIQNPTLREAGKKMLGGAAVAGGAALPVYAVGSALSDKTTADARDRALQTAGGVAGIGLLGYGAKSLMDQAGQDRTRDQNYAAMDAHRAKLSSEKPSSEVYAAMNIEEEKIAHMATCAYLDVQLEALPQTHKIASLRDLNNEFLVDLLATSVKVSASRAQKLLPG
jgi:hypothetical protein